MTKDLYLRLAEVGFLDKFRYIFMVGFPRSGTTLAQTILMCDESVFSIPETHLFTKGLRFNRLPEFLSNIWAGYYCYKWIKSNFDEHYFYYSSSRTKLVKSFFGFIENKAKLENKFIILEKTPGHLNKIDSIVEVFPEAEFIHVTRSFAGAVPSKIKASRQWGGKDDVWSNIRRWSIEILISIYYSDNYNNHFIIDYEDISKNRDEVIRRLNAGLALHIENVDDTHLAKLAESVIEPAEIWKKSNLQGFRSNFDPSIELKGTMRKYVEYLRSCIEN